MPQPQTKPRQANFQPGTLSTAVSFFPVVVRTLKYDYSSATFSICHTHKAQRIDWQVGMAHLCLITHAVSSFDKNKSGMQSCTLNIGRSQTHLTSLLTILVLVDAIQPCHCFSSSLPWPSLKITAHLHISCCPLLTMVLLSPFQ